MNESSELSSDMDNISQMLYEMGQALRNCAQLLNKDYSQLIDSITRLSELSKAVDNLLDNQIIMVDRLPDELEREILVSDNIPVLIEEYYSEDNDKRLHKVIHRCKSAEQLKKHEVLFDQTVEAYKIGSYHLSCMGLFAIADELLTHLSGLYGTRANKRISEFEESIKETVELAPYDPCLYSAYSALSEHRISFYNSMPFSNKEPTELNRHWTMHGRSSRDYKKIDFIRVLLWIDALTRLDGFR